MDGNRSNCQCDEAKALTRPYQDWGYCQHNYVELEDIREGRDAKHQYCGDRELRRVIIACQKKYYDGEAVQEPALGGA